MTRDLEAASDFELLRASRSDERAFVVFYRRYERLVVGWLVRRTGRPDLAAELTAEVFAAAYLASDRFRDGPQPAGAWLLGIARNKLLRSLRRDRIDASARRRLGMAQVSIGDDALAAVERLGSENVLALLDHLPPGQRDAVRARIVDEAAYDEIAARFNVSPALARQRVSRGLAALRRRITEEGGA